GDADQVLLADADVEMPVGEARRERPDGPEILRDEHHVGIRLRELDQHRGRRQRREVAAHPTASSAVSVRRTSSSLSVGEWASAVPATCGPPSPLTVCATMAGGPAAAGTAASAATMARMSWPSISRTFQRNARHLSASGSSGRTSSTAPPAWNRL